MSFKDYSFLSLVVGPTALAADLATLTTGDATVFATLQVVDATAPPTAHPADPTTPTAAPPTVPITPPTAPPNQIYIVHGIWSNRKVVYLILPIRRNS